MITYSQLLKLGTHRSINIPVATGGAAAADHKRA